MSESHICKICGNPATVHLTQIVGNKIQKIDLCEACAKEKGVTDPEGFSLGDILSAPSAASGSKDAMVCEQCGFSPKDFKKLGRFGCPACYEHFSPILEPMLRNIHRDSVHRGKVPGRSLARMSMKREIEDLEGRLRDAVADERFEDAAELRDQIGMLKQTLESPVESPSE